MADVFFSYKREDRGTVEPLVRLLERAGFSVWWDPTLVAGERFDQVIHREIETADCVMVAWSANSVEAVWVRDEASAGRDRGILVPLTLDGMKPPLGFRQYQTPDLTGWSGDESDPRVRQLVAGVGRAIAHARHARGEPVAGPEVGAEPMALPVPDLQETVSPAAAATAPSRETPARAAGIPRRRLLRYGLAACGVGLASAGGIWFGMPMLKRGKLPPTRTERFDLVTVDERGDPNPQQSETIDVFELPVGDAKIEFSVIPSGGFQIGSPDSEILRRPNEGPQQFVELKSFALSRTTITQAQWAALVGAAPDMIGQTLAPYPSFFRGDDLPVETVSWNHANEFCRRLSRLSGLRIRLPTEAEWEYSCRARTTSPFHFGPTITPDLANYCGLGGAVAGENDGKDISSPTYNGVAYPSGAYDKGPVAIAFLNTTVKARSFPPNRFGLFQMHGNVWEHCLDTALAAYQLIPKDGAPFMGPGNDHMLRGGAWSHNPAICRSAYRDSMHADSVGWQGRVGLRVVCEL